jgi:hypothetical protein
MPAKFSPEGYWRASLCPSFSTDQLILLVLMVLRVGQFRITAGSIRPLWDNAGRFPLPALP